MKLNKSYISKVLFGALLLLEGASFTACTETNDWDVDPAYDRLFHSSKLEVKVGEDNAEVTFKKMPNVEYYVIEYSTDSLSDEVETTAHSVVLGEDKSITTSPYTITGLEGSTKYFLRIKSCATTGKGSTWKYLDGSDYNYSFTTKAEQIISEVVAGSKTATVKFTPGKAVNKALVLHGDDEPLAYDIPASAVEAGSIVLEGLTPKTSYTVQLLNGENVRGTMKFSTTEAYPDGYEVLTLTSDESLKDLLANATTDKVVVVLPQGLDYTVKSEDGVMSTVKIPENIKSIYFWGAAGESKPSLTFKGSSFEGTDMDVVRFYNLNIQCGSNTDGYVLNQSGSFTVNSIEFEKCNIQKIRGVIRFQNITQATCRNITINDCVLTDIGSYGVVNTKDQSKLTLGSVSIANSTLNTINSVLTNTSQPNFSIAVDHCTIWNCVPGGKPFFDVQKQTGVQVSCTNSLIGAYYEANGEKTVKGNSLKDIDGTGTVYTNDFNWNAGYEIGSQIESSSKQLWVNPATVDADFTVLNSTYKYYGDQRWLPAN